MQTLFENTTKLTNADLGRDHIYIHTYIYIYITNLVLTSFGIHLNNFDTS
jgi:hypothetical protein